MLDKGGIETVYLTVSGKWDNPDPSSCCSWEEIALISTESLENNQELEKEIFPTGNTSVYTKMKATSSSLGFPKELGSSSLKKGVYNLPRTCQNS